ncbi:hypothetical protein [Pseudomonas frederiksbergensis]|uniref:hypothetical protein n=1 Tax=Pseudomonas frederiksbergensis TaxID=104087 RepID=UPI003D1DF109
MKRETYNYKQLEISENLAQLTLRATRTSHSERFLNKIMNKLSRISFRDTFELTLSIDGAETTITKCDQNSLEQLKAYYTENKDESNIIKITIGITKKNINKTISIYSLDSFLEFFSPKSLLEKIETLSAVFEEKVVFEVFNNTDSFGSATISFRSHKKLPSTNDISLNEKRLDRLSRVSESSSFIHFNHKFLPSDFDAKNTLPVNHNLNTFFNKAKLIYSLACISNATEILEEKSISFKINGYRTITTEKESPEKLNTNSDIAYKIYDWIYTDGQCSDKIGLVRNILTLDSTNNRINLSSSTWNTIQANYAIYLKENIGKYLDLKSKLLEYITDFNKRALDATDAFTSSFQNNTIGFTTFIVTVVAINGLKDAGSEKVFSKEYLLIAGVICTISMLWMFISRSDTNNRISYLISHTKDSILKAYSNILSADEVNESIDPTIENIKTHASQRMKKYTTLWVLSTAIFMLLFIIGFLLTLNPTKASSHSGDTKISQCDIPNKLKPTDYL